MKCKNCQKEIVQKSDRRKREFCNNTCKSAYWRKTKSGGVDNKPEKKKADPRKYVQPLSEADLTYQVFPETEGSKKAAQIIEDEIKKKIAAIMAEKIPDNRNTILGRKSWQMEQEARIKELENNSNKQ